MGAGNRPSPQLGCINGLERWRFLFLKIFSAEGSSPQVFSRLDEVKAERFLPVRRAGFGWSDPAKRRSSSGRIASGLLQVP
jgi:hypothetical protein